MRVNNYDANMGPQEQAYMLGQLLVKLALNDIYEDSRTNVDPDALGEMLASMVEGCASALGVRLDAVAIRASRDPFQSKSKIFGFLSASQGYEVANAFELGAWIVFYTTIEGGYPADEKGGRPEQNLEVLRQKLLRRVVAADIDPHVVAPLLEAVKTGGLSLPNEVNELLPAWCTSAATDRPPERFTWRMILAMRLRLHRALWLLHFQFCEIILAV
jgi:hypothetical protein